MPEKAIPLLTAQADGGLAISMVLLCHTSYRWIILTGSHTRDKKYKKLAA